LLRSEREINLNNDSTFFDGVWVRVRMIFFALKPVLLLLLQEVVVGVAGGNHSHLH
jgi:hypothetical protein